MKQTLRSTAAFLCLILSSHPFELRAVSQTPNPPAPDAPALASHAPVAQIAAAHTVFLSNLGADASFPVDATQVYNDIYKALDAWGHYQLVSSPNQADLIFQLRDVSSLTTMGDRHDIYTVNNPTFQLTIVDSKSNIALWTITSPVALAGRKQTRARWLSISETNLISRVKVVAGESLAPAETADLTNFPKTHGGRNALILVAAGGVLAAGSYFLVHHLLADQKASQDAFCNAHQIPLTQCAGG